MVRYTFASELFNKDEVPDIVTIGDSLGEDLDQCQLSLECSPAINPSAWVARANMEFMKRGPLLQSRVGEMPWDCESRRRSGGLVPAQASSGAERLLSSHIELLR